MEMRREIKVEAVAVQVLLVVMLYLAQPQVVQVVLELLTTLQAHHFFILVAVAVEIIVPVQAV